VQVSSFFLECSRPHRELHSFPTRRSSDLTGNAMAARLSQSVKNRLALRRIGRHSEDDAVFAFECRDGCGVVAAPRVVQKISQDRSEEHTSELQSLAYLVCRLLLEKKK